MDAYPHSFTRTVVFMSRSRAWRLPRWSTLPAAGTAGGSSMGPRERLFFFVALACIAVWGFGGSWEFPELEPAERIRAVARSTAAGSPRPASELAVRGAELFEANGCYACHSIGAETRIGPGLGGIYGEPVELSDGTSRRVDDAYLLESILHPQASLVAGFDEAAMPSYDGLVSESDALALVEYIKSLE